MANKNKYYVDMNHPENGIYENWQECEAEKKKGGTNFYGFPDRTEAENALLSGRPERAATERREEEASELILPDVYAFTDGSFNAETGTYGYGGFLISEDKEYILQGSGNDEEAARSRNVSGEVLGAMAAVEKARELNIPKLTIFYDYEGVAKWAQGLWKTNIKLTRDYAEFMQKSGVETEFIHVKAHTGIPGNERADSLAKESVGL